MNIFGKPAGVLPLRPRPIESPLYTDYLEILRRPLQSYAPVNLQNRSTDEIRSAAEYSIRTGTIARDIMRANKIPLNGIILELGPGWDFGGAMILAEDSNRLIVADRFIARWQPEFHLHVYREMQRLLGRPSRLLDEVARNGHYGQTIDIVEEQACDLKSISSGSVDLVYSNAVLEHVHPLDKAAQELFRVTRLGGWGVHQVDFRYHRNFDLPLEHLLFTGEEYERLLELTHCEVGCQTRVREAISLFEKAGFEIVKVDVNMTAPEAYMQEFMPRLQRNEHSPYRNWPEHELAKISARLFVRKPSGFAL